MTAPLEHADVVEKVLGEIRAASTNYAPSGTAGGTRGGTTQENDGFFVVQLTFEPPAFMRFRRAGYQIRTGDLQLGNLQSA
jgi:hypothetical protein